MAKDMKAPQADHYYGKNAMGYEAQRKHKRMWGLEHSLVSKLVSKGPVLDIPCGTGRYFPIYKEKNLDFVGVDISRDMLEVARDSFPHANVREGSIFNTSFSEKQFGTAVCTRMMHWFNLEQMCAAFRELERVSREIIVTVGLGEERKVTATYDHSEENWKKLTEAWLPERHFLEENTGRNVWWMYKFRKPTMADVELQFADRAPGTAKTLIEIWCRLLKIEPPASLGDAKISHVYRSNDTLKYMMDWMATHQPAMWTTMKARRTDQPIVLVRWKGHEFMIDGRRRCNRFAREKGLYSALLLDFDNPN